MCYERGHFIDYHCVSCHAQMPPLFVTRKWCQIGPRNHQPVHPEAQCQKGFEFSQAEPTRTCLLLLDPNRPDPAYCDACVARMQEQATAAIQTIQVMEGKTVSTGAMEHRDVNQAHPETPAQGCMRTHAPLIQSMLGDNRNIYAWAPGGSRVAAFDGLQRILGQEEAADRMAQAVAEDMYKHQQAYQ